MTALQIRQDILTALQREMQDDPKIKQLDEIIKTLVAAHGEEYRKMIAELLVLGVTARGAAAIWTAS
jgi:DNA-directed RNA polymerase subunit H (RpoH/RPB5)